MCRRRRRRRVVVVVVVVAFCINFIFLLFYKELLVVKMAMMIVMVDWWVKRRLRGNGPDRHGDVSKAFSLKSSLKRSGKDAVSNRADRGAQQLFCSPPPQVLLPPLPL